MPRKVASFSASGSEGGMLREVLPQGSWLLPSLADLCQGRQTLLGLASESQARLRAEPRAEPRGLGSPLAPPTRTGLGSLATFFYEAWGQFPSCQLISRYCLTLDQL